MRCVTFARLDLVPYSSQACGLSKEECDTSRGKLVTEPQLRKPAKFCGCIFCLDHVLRGTVSYLLSRGDLIASSGT